VDFEKSRWVNFLLQKQKINSEVILLLLKKQQSEVAHPSGRLSNVVDCLQCSATAAGRSGGDLVPCA